MTAMEKSKSEEQIRNSGVGRGARLNSHQGRVQWEGDLWVRSWWMRRRGQYGFLLLLFSHSVVSNPLQPHGLQHARLPCPSLSARACSNSHTLSQWCHPTISSSAVPLSCLQSFPASGTFSMSLLFASGGQSIGASASASVLPMFGKTNTVFQV